MDDVIAEATSFIAECYDSKKLNTLSEVWLDVWSSKMPKSHITSASNLKVLPPTSAAFEPNVLRDHIQTAIWKSGNQSGPPDLEPTYGWTREEASKSPVPVTIPPNLALAPSEVLLMIHCGCGQSYKQCYTAQCRCSSAKLSCTIFCACRGEVTCKNERTQASAIFKSASFINLCQIVWKMINRLGFPVMTEAN